MNRGTRFVIRAVIFAVVLAGLAVAGTFIGFVAASAGGANAIHSTIVETGSSLQAPLFGEWSPAYQQVHPDVLLAPAKTDSGTGIKDAENGLAAIGAADLPAPAAKGILSVPLTVAGVAVIYNLPGHLTVNLNGQVLAGIYSGRITTWNAPAIQALNPKAALPAQQIVPLERSDSSGTTFQFTRYLQEQSQEGWPIPAKTQNWPVGVGEQGTDAMISGCAKTPGCIAYVGVSYDANAQAQYHLQIAALADKAGKFLLPTLANMAPAVAQFAPQYPHVVSMINAVNGYPMVSYEFAVVKQQQSSGQAATAIRAFLQWAVTSGSSGKYLNALNFLPLPANVLASAQAQIGSIR